MRCGRLDSTGPHACLPKGAPFPAEVSAASALCSQSRLPPRMAAATGEGGDPPGRGTLTARNWGLRQTIAPLLGAQTREPLLWLPRL